MKTVQKYCLYINLIYKFFRR